MYTGNASHMEVRMAHIKIVGMPVVGQDLGSVYMFAFGKAVAVFSRLCFELSDLCGMRTDGENLCNRNEQPCTGSSLKLKMRLRPNLV